MSLDDVQKEVDRWTGSYVPQYWPPANIMLRLQEEVGELAREINHRYGPKKKKSTEETAEVGDEIADIMFTLVCLANSQGISLQDAWNKMMGKYSQRDADRFEKNSGNV